MTTTPPTNINRNVIKIISSSKSRSKSNSKNSSKNNNKNNIGPIRSLFMIIIVICLTLMIVELRGFNKKQTQNNNNNNNNNDADEKLLSISSSSLCVHNNNIDVDHPITTKTKTTKTTVPPLLNGANTAHWTPSIVSLSSTNITINNNNNNNNNTTKPQFIPTKLTNSTLVVLVLSRRDSFKIRETIRKTWASTSSSQSQSQVDDDDNDDNNNNNVYFVVGRGCNIPRKLRARDEGGSFLCEVAPEPLPTNYRQLIEQQYKYEYNEIEVRLQLEQHKYNDMIISQDYVDIYRNLPMKLKSGYKFVVDYLPNVHWILKVDDDFYVRVREFHRYLDEQYGPLFVKNENNEENDKYYNIRRPSQQQQQQQQPQRPIIPPLCVGNIKTNNIAYDHGKWSEVPQYPINSTYPPFPLGSAGHAITRPIFEYIVYNSHLLFNYQGEDVSIGIWIQHYYNNNNNNYYYSSSESESSSKSSESSSMLKLFISKFFGSTTSSSNSNSNSIFKQSNRMVNDGNCYDTINNLVIGHGISYYGMLNCWKHRNVIDPKKQIQVLNKWNKKRKRYKNH